MGQITRAFGAAIFMSRWLLAPFLVGMALTLFLLIFRLFADFWQLAIRLPGSTWHELIVGVLNMIDITLTANLVLVAIFSGYQNFIHKVEARLHDTWPGGLTALDLVTVKQRLLGSIMVIASVEALAWYLDLEKEGNNMKLGWGALFPLMFGIAMLAMALADRIAGHTRRSS
jgi:uncharacterized protein (TIGR00645 family)